MNHEELKELVPMMALDALPAAEEMELRTHLQDCSECTELYRGYSETASDLAISVVPVAPGAALRDRLLDEIRHQPQVGADVISIGEKPGWRRSAATLSAAAALVFAMTSGALLLKNRDQQSELAEQRRALAVISASTDRLTMAPGPDAPAASGRIFLPAGNDSLAAVVSGLDDPGKKVYALWVIVDGKPKHLADFKPDASGSALVYIDRPVVSFDGLAITLEPKKDATAPTGPIYLSA